jgi:hypothetical protein
MKEYLGDGVYVDYDGDLILTTDNGIEITNTIYLGQYEINNLVEYIKKNNV